MCPIFEKRVHYFLNDLIRVWFETFTLKETDFKTVHYISR